MTPKDKTILIVTISLLIVIVLSLMYFSDFGLNFKNKADVVENKYSVDTTIAYKKEDEMVNESYNSKIILVQPLIVNALLNNKTTKNNFFTINFIDPSTGQSKGQMTVQSVDGRNFIDWLNLDSIDAETAYDIRISSKGYLSRTLKDVILKSVSANFSVSNLIAGDVNQDQKINWQDYIDWKKVYGSKTADGSTDFNGDGIVNFLDYAVSFGTRCYNATEKNQDEQCKK